MKILLKLSFLLVIFPIIIIFFYFPEKIVEFPIKNQKTDSAEEIFPPEEIAFLSSPQSVFQGETLIIEFFPAGGKLILDEQEIPYSDFSDRQIAFVGFDTREKIGEKILVYKTEFEILKTPFEILGKNYPVTKIVIPEKLASKGITSKEIISSIQKTEAVSLSEIMAETSSFYYFSEPFIQPLEKWIDVGGFGNIREDKHGAIRHLGVDLDGKIGDPVFSSNAGKIAFAGYLQNYGHSVVIDHGLGIYSLYLHLSETLVKTGEKTEKGGLIGLIGNSGDYSLSPHLHFSIKIRGTSVSPKNFIEISQKLFD